MIIELRVFKMIPVPFVVAFSTGSCTCIMGVSTQLVIDMLPQPLSTNLKIQVQPSSSIGLIILKHIHKCTYYNYIHVHDYSYIFRAHPLQTCVYMKIFIIFFQDG